MSGPSTRKRRRQRDDEEEEEENAPETADTDQSLSLGIFSSLLTFSQVILIFGV